MGLVYIESQHQKYCRLCESIFILSASVGLVLPTVIQNYYSWLKSKYTLKTPGLYLTQIGLNRNPDPGQHATDANRIKFNKFDPKFRVKF